MLESVLILIFAITVLYFGAEFTLSASEELGARIGLSPLLVGMLLIGFGTSLPEMFVAHIAASQDKIGIAVGSLVGSNIANMLLILGMAGLFAKLSVFTHGIKTHLGIHLLLCVALGLVLTRAELNFLTTLPLLVTCGIYLYVIKKDLDHEKNNEREKVELSSKPAVIFIKLIAGFGMLYIGGEYLVVSGTKLCLALGISEYIVSAIFIAFGTSFPELVTAMLAALKKKDTDLIIGNIVGSNIFNCGFILGSLGIYEIKLGIDFKLEIITLIVGALALLMLSSMERYFYRKTSALFLLGYVGVVYMWTQQG